MTEETKDVVEEVKPEEAEQKQPTTRRGAKQQQGGIQNVRKGNLNLGGILRMKPDEVVQLTKEQKADKVLMQKIERGLEIGLLKEV
jgi:hypothetical protein